MKLIEQEVPGIYIHSIQIGSNFEEDFLSGFFKNSNDQVPTVQHTALSHYTQHVDYKMHNFMSFSRQQNHKRISTKLLHNSDRGQKQTYKRKAGAASDVFI